ncbi:phospholipid carrier-dependent glycosyltransferase [Pontiella agarivorans]|uniref:Phospholipid carrier-dependent glycosyltransferase n=1 Tax=Pontiella agarivorans TaxID=3038953 RepID=A0ABU5MYU9_9BACT|nr:phospholipid carrier-dependent glycosyltransferase [Pontiella agarivorans]MDZ8119379.1 phospholipid carrier-dependent glycosyltransferase [Pontiella agarivorans]
MNQSQKKGFVVHGLYLFLGAMLTYSIFSYWGIRAPDSEIMFRSAQGLIHQGDFSVEQELAWKEFGIATGIDGKNYSIFGPGQAVVSAGLVFLAEQVVDAGFFDERPFLIAESHYFEGGIRDFVNGAEVKNIRGHAVRSLMGWFNILVASLCVVVFYGLVHSFEGSNTGSLLSSILFAFGTPILAYSGTFFSELLAMLFSMLAMLLIIKASSEIGSDRYLKLLVGGLLLGVSILVHITAILFVPFFIFSILLSPKAEFRDSLCLKIKCAGIFASGVFLALVVLGFYNFNRFGSVWETGRTVEGAMRYGGWTSPLHGIQGLLFSAGKGFFFYCPAIILGLALWKRFYLKNKVWALSLMGACLFRLVFIASRSDWSGGLCLGPRYLIVLIPFLLLPVGVYLGELRRTGSLKAFIGVGLFSGLCVIQQIYFALGDVFSYWRLSGMQNGVNLFKGGLIYETWEVSPLLFILSGLRAPLLLQWVACDNWTLFSVLSAIAGLLLFYVYYKTLKCGSMK